LEAELNVMRQQLDNEQRERRQALAAKQNIEAQLAETVCTRRSI
jgi:hypothetical protein